MSYATTAAFATKPPRRLAPLVLDRITDLAKRFVNALVASRVRAAELELRRYEALIGETARLHGAHRRVSLATADLLPFNISRS